MTRFGLVLAACSLLGQAALAQQALVLDGYEVLGGGDTVKDPKTGLEWMRCSLGQQWDGKTCAGSVQQFGFALAQQQAKALNQAGGLGGQTDWRLPTVRELAGLVRCSSGKTKDQDDPKDGAGAAIPNWCDGEFAKPTIAQSVFAGTPAQRFWTASPYAGHASYAWTVYFDLGYLAFDSKEAQGAVRMVRAGAAATAVRGSSARVETSPPAVAGTVKASPGGQANQRPVPSVSPAPSAQPAGGASKSIDNPDVPDTAVPQPATKKDEPTQAPANAKPAETPPTPAHAGGTKKAHPVTESKPSPLQDSVQKDGQDEATPAPSACARLSNGMSVRVRVSGQPQPQPAMVLSVSGGSAEVRVMMGAAAGRKLRVACSAVRR